MRCAQAPDLALALLIAVAAAFDIRFYRIPNWLVLTGILAGFILNRPGYAAAGLGVGFALYFPLYLLRARGAGDVKLLAAVGALSGPGNCLWIFVATAILGGLFALVLVTVRGRFRRTMFNTGWILGDLLRFRAPYRRSPELDVTSDKGMRLPHAAMLAAGTFAFMMMGQTCP